ncbi:MAG: HAMP domain-containing sensor histidine kinase [Actinomycetota bacterium]
MSRVHRPPPLRRVRSIKTKWSIIIIAAVAVTAGVSQIGYYLGWPVWIRPIISATLALVAVQFLATGLTWPLREMARAADGMATGEYHRRVTPRSQDEVGQLARSFNVMAAELAEADRVRKEFVANASHELRTPVAALRSQIENVADGVTEPTAATVNHMLAQAEHLSKLVTQLLDLGRLESPPDGPPTEAVDLDTLLKEVASEAELIDPDAAISLSVSGPLLVAGDEARLHQLFTNLVSNALRFAPSGSDIRIEAEAGPVEIEIRVIDTGPGIAPEHRARVFERFWQADGSSLTGGGGAGLGLAICKRIVDRHLGTITLTSNTPRGTCAVVTLPVQPDATT